MADYTITAVIPHITGAWSDWKIRAWAEEGGLTPFDPATLNPASVNLTISGRARRAMPEGWSDVFEFDELVLPPQPSPLAVIWREVSNAVRRVLRLPLITYPSTFFLLDSLEYLDMPADAMGLIALRSSWGRKGVEHLHAGDIDPGFTGTVTFELENRAPWPAVIRRGDKVLQMIMLDCYLPERGYDQTGRYNGQCRPQPAK